MKNQGLKEKYNSKFLGDWGKLYLTRACSGSLLRAIIAITCPFSKYFQILHLFAQIFEYFALFCPFYIFFCPFSEKNRMHALTF